MSNLPACPQCSLENTYPDGDNFVCPDCGFEWPQSAVATDGEDVGGPVKDANGNPLADGDTVILIKDLKVKGSSIVLKKAPKSRVSVCRTVPVTMRWTARPSKAPLCSRPNS